MEPFAKRPRVEGAIHTGLPAEEALTFHLLKKDAEGRVVIEENGNFPPEMTHQLFGEKEEIVGYDGLSIDVWLTPQFQAFIDVKYAAKGPGATELKQPFADAFEAGFFQDKAQFDAALQEEAGIDVGLLGEQVASRETEEGSTFRVCHAHLATANPALKAMHARLQPLLYFFVDAASTIDQEDEGWHLLTAVEQSPEGVEVLGFATVYRHYHYPAGARLKLAQILVLPPHQGRGAGSMLLQAAQGLAEQTGACDLSFEDPADALQALRTGLDVQRALALDWAQAAAAERISALAGDKGKSSAATANGSGSGSGKAARLAALEHPLAAPAEVLSRLRSELRLTRLQAGVVWRVLVYVVGKGEAAVVEGVKGMIRQQLVAQLAAAKEDAQGKSVRETDKGFIMCRGAATTKSAIPLLPVEEQSAEQQADAVEESTEQQLEAVAAVAAKFLLLEDEEDEE
ncbi:hypothetical protein CHLNCDRAFT_145199 [Chlorella variabilis]|uniref:histone acetyltransferase n=1 Tax=Chlorella variabilis TaxID=554065 RepID=E1ZDW8_CHLVA|nr:hypothetical protein CHLNCDRAFT_145199 [Chlorella variabilis]EFN55767.1 hypothetical protein CHLNCDRAFT_145199 [Chlorella variabilis]|eukprot:XP_005847869.1 hypothetical protein CHLNCDRAFT_145199 [Chlorella variabilis]